MPVSHRVFLTPSDAALKGPLILNLLITDRKSDIQLVEENGLFFNSLECKYQVLCLLRLNSRSAVGVSREAKGENVESAGVRLTHRVGLREKSVDGELCTLLMPKHDAFAVWIAMALTRAGVDVYGFSKVDVHCRKALVLTPAVRELSEYYDRCFLDGICLPAVCCCIDSARSSD